MPEISAKTFFDRLLNPRDKTKREEFNLQLFQKPQRDTGDDATTFEFVSPHYFQQADLVYLPNDAGYMYALVVTDQGSRLVDAQALKEKTAEAVLSAFQVIYKRKILQIPKVMTCDSGTEFKSVTKTGLQQLGITMKYIKKGRHRSVGLVERKNQTIGNLVHKRIAYDEKQSGQSSSKWVEYLPTIVASINTVVTKVLKKRLKDDKKDIKPVVEDSKSDVKDSKDVVKPPPIPTVNLLNVGQRVRVQLDEPMNLDGTRLPGKFRTADIRFHPEIRTIKEVLMKPSQPILYLLNGASGPLEVEDIGYTYNQLQIVKDSEVAPIVPAKRANNVAGTFEVDKLIGKKTVGRTIYYLVLWKGYKKKDATFEKKSSLMKSIPNLVARYDKQEAKTLADAEKILGRKKKKNKK